MSLSIFPVTGIPFLTLCVFAVAFAGYALGRVTVRGVSLGTAGVFVAALLFGCFAYEPLSARLASSGAGGAAGALKIVENLGLALFVTSVGFIAGPGFFTGLKKHFKSYVALAAVIIFSGTAVCVLCVTLLGCEAPMAVGILSGALTSTPAFSAARETVAAVYTDPALAARMEEMVTVGHGIAYLFGVVGVVLFVQLVPRLERADMAAERALLSADAAHSARKAPSGRRGTLDKFGLAPFALAVAAGLVIGSVKIPLGSASFSLGTTGGTLIAALVVGHFGHVGPLDARVPRETVDLLRELGLALFLIGAGIPGGAKFTQYFKGQYFLYGALMTAVSLAVGYLFARRVLKINLLSSLGSITGGMTSTPALGALINVAGSDDVVAAYAATYPVALALRVLTSQLIIIIFH